MKKYRKRTNKNSSSRCSNKKIENGDIVEVFNKRGKCLAGVIISEEVMKGVVFLPVGAWYDPIDDGAYCIHGNPNVLTEDIGTSS